MMKSSFKYIWLMLSFVLAAGCTNAQKNTQLNLSAGVDHDTFGKYWYQGKAELNSFKLEELRYGEVRDASVVMVFVTEDFLTDKQVKLESPPEGREHLTVLKLNYMEEFTTGIYEYNMMASVFSPVKVNEYPQAQKVSISSQDWCGHSYYQLNLGDNGYDLMGHSYFESEADFSTTLPATLLEDEVWTKLRMNPELLPEGQINIVPGGFYQRFSHDKWQPRKATARHSRWNGDEFPGEDLMAYTITYTQLDRELTIIYENKAPYKIAGWIKKRGQVTLRAVRQKTVVSQYWDQHDNDDLPMRDSLGISRKNLQVNE